MHYRVAFVTWILISLIKMKEIRINIALLCNKLKGKRHLISSYNKPINGPTHSLMDRHQALWDHLGMKLRFYYQLVSIIIYYLHPAGIGSVPKRWGINYNNSWL